MRTTIKIRSPFSQYRHSLRSAIYLEPDRLRTSDQQTLPWSLRSYPFTGLHRFASR